MSGRDPVGTAAHRGRLQGALARVCALAVFWTALGSAGATPLLRLEAPAESAVPSDAGQPSDGGQPSDAARSRAEHSPTDPTHADGRGDGSAEGSGAAPQDDALDDGGGADVDPAVGEALVDALAAAFGPLQEPASWLGRVDGTRAATPDADVLFAIREQGQRVAVGRDQFFENDFERAVTTLRATFERVEQTPGALAFAPEATGATVEGALTWVRALETLGRDDDAAAAMERIVAVLWHVDPDPSAHPPRVLDAYERARGLLARRDVAWSARRDDCQLLVNGAPAATAASGVVSLPTLPTFVQLVCDDARSDVYRVAPDATAIRFDVRWDLARAGATEPAHLLSPADAAAETEALSQHAAALVDADTVLSIGAGRDGWVVTRWETGGVFRAARCARTSCVEAAVAHLETGAGGDVTTWVPGVGWSSEQRVRTPGAWVAGGVALTAAGAAVALELATADARSDVDRCADRLERGCSGETLQDRRSSARRRRAGANASWALAGAGLVTAVVARLVHARGHAMPEVSASFSPRGATLSTTWTW